MAKGKPRQWRIWASRVDRAEVTPELVIDAGRQPKVQEARRALGMMGKRGWKIEIRAATPVYARTGSQPRR